MDRRDFIKVSGAAAAGMALGGCAPRESKQVASVPLVQEWPQYKDRIARDVEVYDPLNIKEITVEIGLKEPFDVMHLSDTHIARADARDDERKIQLSAQRSQWMNAGEHYLDDIHRFLISDAQTVDKFRFLSQPVHEVVDLRAAAVHQHDAHADEPQQDDVLHDLLLQLVVDHGVAAVFHHDDFAVVAADVGQGGSQDLGPLHIGQISVHWTETPLSQVIIRNSEFYITVTAESRCSDLCQVL